MHIANFKNKLNLENSVSLRNCIHCLMGNQIQLQNLTHYEITTVIMKIIIEIEYFISFTHINRTLHKHNKFIKKSLNNCTHRHFPPRLRDNFTPGLKFGTHIAI